MAALVERESTDQEYSNVNLEEMGQKARQAGRTLATLTTDAKNAALLAIADALEASVDEIIAQNARDIKDGRTKGLTDALLDRLLLTPERVAGLAADARSVAGLPDPVGAEIEGRLLPNGIRLSKRRMPIGVMGVIYEARPNVTIDIATLSLKTGNAVILRGGSETLRSNVALISVIHNALDAVGVPRTAVQLIDSPDRALVGELLRLDKYVDMIIPRGGHSLHQRCKEESSVPVITGGIGICHLFVDESADFEKSIDIIENAKVQRPSVCNALDTVLVHRSVAANFLPQMARRMAQVGVELRADNDALNILQLNSNGSSHGSNHSAKVLAAGPDDFSTEWMALILGVKIVDSLDQAVDHIEAHSMNHSDGILTNDWTNATDFVNAVTSSGVFVNASTRFNDGGQFGLGAEVAVSTQKLHARGPMGLEELTTYKWVCLGDYHVRG